MILWALREAIDFDLSAQTKWVLALAALQFVVFVLFVGWGAYRGSSEITPRAAGIMPALFVFSLLPLYVAFSYLHTSVDTVFFMYANAAIALGVLVQTTIERVFRIPKSGMSTLLWSAARLITARSVAVSVVCAAVVWVSYNYLVPDDMKAAASRAAQVASRLNLPLTSTTSIVKQVTNISELPPLELPPLPASSSAPNRWDLIEGLNAEVQVAGISAVVSGQRILRLVAVGADRRHALGARFGDLAPGRNLSRHRLGQSRTRCPRHDRSPRLLDPNTGNPSNYGVARFDLAARSVVNSTGDIIASGVDAAEDDWVKVWVDLRSRDGQIFALIGLLEGRNNRHVFTPAGQSVIFGGFEIFPPRVVKSLSQVSSPPPRTDIVTKVTNISELPTPSRVFLRTE